jgi:hypothetical protein
MGQAYPGAGPGGGLPPRSRTYPGTGAPMGFTAVATTSRPIPQAKIDLRRGATAPTVAFKTAGVGAKGAALVSQTNSM